MNTAALALTLALGLGRVESAAQLPPLEDIWRFPRASVCRAWIEAGDRERDLAWKTYYQLPNPKDQLFSAYAERISSAVNAWDQLEHAWNENLPEERRRWHLDRLRELIGEQAYFCGFVPVPIELEFFDMGD